MKKVFKELGRKLIFALIAVIVFPFASMATQPTNLYVSLTGSDTNTGAIDSPFATITKARDYIRTFQPLTSATTVHVRAGTYYLDETIVLEPQDSGTADFPITYQAYLDETVILSGGIPIDTTWSSTNLNNTNDIYKTDLSSSMPSTYDNRDKIIMKYNDSGVTETGSWLEISYPYSTSEKYLSDGNIGKGSKSVKFSPTITNGEYAVYIKWAAVSQDPTKKVLETNAKKVPVTVYASSTDSQTYIINNTTRGGWYKLGIQGFVDADTPYIEISNEDTDGFVTIDSIMLIRENQAGNPAPWIPRQLFDTNLGTTSQRLDRARTPNKVFENGDIAPSSFYYAYSGDTNRIDSHTSFSANANWATEEDALINIVAGHRFFNQLSTISAVASNDDIYIEDEAFVEIGYSGKNNWFFVEGVKSELDANGEWYLERGASTNDYGTLYYKPANGIAPTANQIVAPHLRSIFYLQGDVTAGTHVEHITISGFDFRHTAYTLGHVEPRANTDGALWLENAKNNTIANNKFNNVGGYAIWLHLDSHNNVIDNNTSEESGAGFVLMTGSVLSYQEPHLIIDYRDKADTVYPLGNEVTNNTVNGTGLIRAYNAGVHMDSRPETTSLEMGNYIAHNEFHNLGRNGVFAFRHQGGNVIEYNHIYDGLQRSLDGAAIHFATMNKIASPNFIQNNYVHHICGANYESSGRSCIMGFGIYLDLGTSNSTVKDNFLHDLHDANGYPANYIKLCCGENYTTYNNVTSPNNLGQSLSNTTDYEPGSTQTNNIADSERQHTGTLVRYDDSSNYSEVGNWSTHSKLGLADLFTHFYRKTTDHTSSTYAEFNLPITESGTYDLYFFGLGKGDHTSSAPVKLNGTLLANVNQKSDQFWLSLGSSYLNAATSNTVKIEAVSTDNVIASKIAAIRSEEPSGTVIVDNSDAEFSKVGAWTSSTFSPGYYGVDYEFETSGGTNVYAQWKPNLAAAGKYEVYIRWTSDSNRSTAVPTFVVYKNGQFAQSTQNQTTNGGQWVSLGTYEFDAGTSGYVKIKDLENNIPSVADAVKFEPRFAIVDNTDAEFSTVGEWTPSTYSPGYYGTNYKFEASQGANKSAYAQWTPDLPVAGNYEVFIRWTSHANRSTAVPTHVVYQNGAVSSSTQDQTINGGQWNSLGTFAFDKGSAGYVKIKQLETDGYSIADAVKFVLQ